MVNGKACGEVGATEAPLAKVNLLKRQLLGALRRNGKASLAKAIDNDLIEGISGLGRGPWRCESRPVELDPSIEEVGWCLIPPEEAAWGAGEIERIKSHDWSASISLGS